MKHDLAMTAEIEEFTSEHTPSSGVLGQLGLNAGQFAAQMINFLLVLTVLWFLILKPLTKKMEERRKIIDESLDKAKKIESELRMAEQKAQAVIDRAKSEGSAVVQEALSEAEAAAEKTRQKAKQQIETLVAQARKKIDEERGSMRQELRVETASLVVSALEKLLPEKFDKKTDENFIKEILKGLEG